MVQKWFQMNEVMAGKKRLFLTFLLYKIFGCAPLRAIAFFGGLCTFLGQKERRDASFQFFKSLNEFKKDKRASVGFFDGMGGEPSSLAGLPIFISSLAQFLNYANSLADKIISFSGGLSADKIRFVEGGECVFELLKNKKGIFFLTTHIGNVEILRSLLQNPSNKGVATPFVNIFLEKRSCLVFNEFIKELEKNTEKASRIESFAVEDTGADTAILISDKLARGEIVFMAGDRVAFSNEDSVYEADFLGKKVKLPIGALKFARMLDVPVFYIACIKCGRNFEVYARRAEIGGLSRLAALNELKRGFGAFLEEFAVAFPRQFYHFYKFLG